MNAPIISVVIPCYNHGQYIDEAIKSVEESTNKDYEIIIVNDGSTDGFTNTRLKELKNYGYNILFQQNQGLGKTRNNGIRLAKGKYILPLDADNIIKPEFMSKAVNILEANSEISIVYSDRQLIGNSNDLVKVGEFDLSILTIENYIDACAVYRKDVWEEIGGYDENMPMQGFEDWDFWLSAAEKRFRFFYIPEPLYYYRILGASMIQQYKENTYMKPIREYVYKKHIWLILKEVERLKNELKVYNYDKGHPLRTSIKYLYKSLYNHYVAFNKGGT